MVLSPIVIFVYNRPIHTLKSLRSLKSNLLSQKSELYVFCDGPKEDANDEDLEKIQEVRKIVRSDSWCSKVEVIEQEKNLGLAKSITEGVTSILKKYDRVIVLEDDLVVSEKFLDFMNDSLKLFKDSKRVMSISGYNHNFGKKQPKNHFFLDGASCWGWATWKRAWKHYINEIDIIIDLFDHDKKAWNTFRSYGSNLVKQLIDNRDEIINTWAIKWRASVILQNGVSLYPNKSYVKNLGFDGSGVHGMNDGNYDNFDFLNNDNQRNWFPSKISVNKKLKRLWRNLRGGKSFKQVLKRIAVKIYSFLSKNVYVFGDSHAEVFHHIDNKIMIPFTRFYTTSIGGATAQGLRNPNSKTNSVQIFKKKIEKIRNKRATIILLLGEVDTGFVIWYRAQKHKEDPIKQMLNSLNAYEEFIKWIISKGFKNIILISAPLPTIKDNQTWGEIANHRKEIMVSQKDRTELTIKYNTNLKKIAETNKIKCINLDKILINRKTILIDDKYINKDKDNHHLDTENYSKEIATLLKKNL